MPDAAPGTYTPRKLVQCADQARISFNCSWQQDEEHKPGYLNTRRIRIQSVSLVKIDTPSAEFCDGTSDLPSDSKPCIIDTNDVLFRKVERICTTKKRCAFNLRLDSVPPSSREQCVGEGQYVYVLQYQCMGKLHHKGRTIVR